MRKINKPNSDCPDILSNNNTLEAIQKIAISGDKNLISETIYRASYSTPDGNQSYIVDALDLSYHYKCAYCERVTKADVEHYRPKKKVSDDKDHPGYYWLCYEWTNLIPACITCNREGAKHNSFPILGNRVYSPTFDLAKRLDFHSLNAYNNPLLSEIPYLLHPEIDIPEIYFTFKIDSKIGIRIEGIDSLGRGEKTISICKLNRQELRVDRHNHVVLDFVEAVHSLFGKLKRGSISNEQFKDRLIEIIESLSLKARKETFSFTLLRKHIIKSEDNFKEIILPFLKVHTQKIVLEAFREVYI